MTQSRIKKEALVYLTKTSINYFKDINGQVLNKYGGLTLGAFYKALRGDPVRYETAIKALTILGVPPEKRAGLIANTRTEHKPSDKPERSNRDSEGTVVSARTH